MRKYSIAWFGFAIMALAACEQPVPRSAAEQDFNVSGYVQQEIKRLQASQPAVLKSVETEKEPAETIQVDNLDWAEELAVFEEADINKPTLREYYTSEKQALPDGGTAITYTKKEDARTPVERLYLQLSPDQKLQHLEATFKDQNLLFFSKRKAILQADPATGNLAGYSIKGVQKLIFGDSLHYSIQANL